MFRWIIREHRSTSGTAAALTITTLNPNLKPPEAWNWNVTVQRELPLNSVLSVGYVAHRGLHAWQVYDINQPTAGALQANPGVNVNSLRPYQGFAAIQEEESAVNSMYSSLQVAWNRRFNNGSMFGVTYTLSKSMDGGSNYRDIVPDTYNTSNLWGPSEYDTRHIVIVNYLYDLPFFKNQQHAQGQNARRVGGRRRRPVPDGYALRHRHQQRFRRRWRVRQFRLRLARPVLGYERTRHRQHRSLCRTRHHVRFSHLFLGQRHATGSRHLQSAARRARLGLPARHTGLEPVRCSRNSRSTSGPDSSFVRRHTTSSIMRT